MRHVRFYECHGFGVAPWRDGQVRYARAPARDFTGATARVTRDPDAIPA